MEASPRRWFGLLALTLPCIMYAMDMTVLNLALPHISKELQPSSTQLLWIVDIYGFMVAGFLITMGSLGDRIGRRKLLLIGAGAFGFSSVIAAFSPTPEMLIISRAALGIAGATLAPSSLSLIRNMFPDPNERIQAISVWGMSFSLGASIGPIVGGILLEYFWWGSVFLVGVPVMIVLLIIGPYLLPEFKDSNAGRIDFPSAMLSLLAVLAVIFGLKQTVQYGLGWLSALSIVMAVVLGSWFIKRQLMLIDPLIDIRLFENKAFGAALATNVLACFACIGLFFYVAQYLQLVLELSPMEASFVMMPSSIAIFFVSMLVPFFLRYFRPVYILSIGLGFASAGYYLLTIVDGAPGLYLLLFASVIYAVGIAPIFPLTTDIIVGAATPERAGAAAAISETFFELGGALGIACLGSLGTAIYRNDLGLTAPNGISAAAFDAARDSLAGAMAVAESLPKETSAVLLANARVAFDHAFDAAAFTSSLMMLLMAIIALIFLRDVGIDQPLDS